MDKITQIMLLSNNQNKELVELVFSKTKKEISEITSKKYSSSSDNLAVDMAVVRLNRLGNEGINSVNFSGVSESYLDGYPQDILDRLEKIKGKKWGVI